MGSYRLYDESWMVNQMNTFEIHNPYHDLPVYDFKLWSNEGPRGGRKRNRSKCKAQRKARKGNR